MTIFFPASLTASLVFSLRRPFTIARWPSSRRPTATSQRYLHAGSTPSPVMAEHSENAMAPSLAAIFVACSRVSSFPTNQIWQSGRTYPPCYRVIHQQVFLQSHDKKRRALNLRALEQRLPLNPGHCQPWGTLHTTWVGMYLSLHGGEAGRVLRAVAKDSGVEESRIQSFLYLLRVS